ncbi:hypothetical protein IHE45_03G071800 [Dioscorea alata]|uniref:Uncharacterized protein n=1 Tax=Dioscorea alata TaxID=55571 RepID=A0ACB7WLQ4_DIOAL|nr:hypothetical protein IHE45_03G071800 [Dioscorea alata]
MEPLAIVAATGAVLGQITVVLCHLRPFISRLIDCLQHPRPPPAQWKIHWKHFRRKHSP